MLSLYLFSILILILQLSTCTSHTVFSLNENAGVVTDETKSVKLSGLVTLMLVTKARPTVDPMRKIENVIHDFLYSHTKADGMDFPRVMSKTEETEDQEPIHHFPSGNIMHAQLFLNKSGVHLPSADLVHREHSRLRVTADFMQTALNAFAIILHGGLSDVRALPPDYVLHSARAISMMKLRREKFATMWDVVLDGKRPESISIETLENYRPLFKYLNGKQIARLNLTDDRILSYIGTHPDLKRHQMGIVASKYMTINKAWSTPKYLNIMNNVLCGVPMTYMRKVSENTFLQLSHQLFYHIRACDPLQKRFYLNMMTKTQALGKAYSWSARDVSRLGLLLAEVDGRWLSAINPAAMAGISSQVMNEIPAKKLQYITEVQWRHLKQKPLNIMARKLKAYRTKVQDSDSSGITSHTYYIIILPLMYVYAASAVN